MYYSYYMLFDGIYCLVFFLLGVDVVIYYSILFVGVIVFSFVGVTVIVLSFFGIILLFSLIIVEISGGVIFIIIIIRYVFIFSSYLAYLRFWFGGFYNVGYIEDFYYECLFFKFLSYRVDRVIEIVIYKYF